MSVLSLRACMPKTMPSGDRDVHRYGQGSGLRERPEPDARALPGMTEKAIEAIIDEAAKRFEIIDCLVIHRIGTLLAGESIVLVAVTSAHRAQAFSGCEFVMDFLKTQAPFWKKEKSAAGSHWVESRASDDTAARRWHEPGE